MKRLRLIASAGCAIVLLVTPGLSSAPAISVLPSATGNKRTIFLIGDSTVKNGRGDGAGGLRGWGHPAN